MSTQKMQTDWKVRLLAATLPITMISLGLLLLVLSEEGCGMVAKQDLSDTASNFAGEPVAKPERGDGLLALQ